MKTFGVAAVLLVLALGFPGSITQAGTIAVFGGYTDPTGADVGLIAHLESLGHTVVYHMPTSAGGQAQIDLANASNVVIISESIGSTSVSTGSAPDGVFHLQNVTKPVISYEVFMFDEAKWTGLTGMVDFGTSGRTNSPAGLEGLSDTIYVNGGHPMAAGLNGATVVYTTPYSACFGIVGPGADVIATIDEAGAFPTLFVYEAGSELIDGSITPGMRIGMFIGQGGYGSIPDPPGVLQFSYIGENGIALLDAAVNYAMIPEPTTMALGLIGFASLAAYIRRRRS